VSLERSRSSPGERRKKALARRRPPTLADPQPDHGKVFSKRRVRAKLEGAGTPASRARDVVPDYLDNRSTVSNAKP
jgi:hypothetical protein